MNNVPHVPRLVSAYYTETPDPQNPNEIISFGTSGHRGSSLSRSFNEDHVLAIVQAIIEYRATHNICGPLFLAADTHALSEPAHNTALEVLAAAHVETVIHPTRGFIPTPVVSRAILHFNSTHNDRRADGIIITPSHNPPEDGGLKYNPPHGGPASSETTRTIQDRANVLLREGVSHIRRVSLRSALNASTTHRLDITTPYARDLARAIDLDAIASSSLRLGVDPLGGAGLEAWQTLAELHNLPIEITNTTVDPSFRFMPPDRDGKIRMDCSSAFAMRTLTEQRDRFDLCFGNDPDADRHGIVTPKGGLMNPNHFLAVAIDYLMQHRPEWPAEARIGKTLVSSAMIDRVVQSHARQLAETPVGFKWFSGGLFNSSFCFGGEESAGASFLQRDGSTWTTDKDGLLLCLLAAEITAVTGKDPHDHYTSLTERFGAPLYTRLSAPASREERSTLKGLNTDAITAKTLASETILSVDTHASGNGAPIGGLKITTKSGWVALRPSGTEPIYKIYAESFRDQDHLNALTNEAQTLITSIFNTTP